VSRSERAVTGAAPGLEELVIQSHRGPYTLSFDEDALASLNASELDSTHFIIDDKVAGLYAQELSGVLASPSVLRIEATEENKSLDKFPAYVEQLVSQGIRRGHVLVAIGGGIIQDITCFLAATLLRGLKWHFYPTTLLAQADSCIGSKSSINVGKIKNVLGTFTPPRQITISTRVLTTLDELELRSGIGEMLKVHGIDGPASFDRIAADYPRLTTDSETLQRYIRRSLEIKKAIIEQDEFDRGIRNVMNYGHSFGHAIESATGFCVPHGIAVTIGVDMANFVAAQTGRSDARHYARMHPTLAANFAGFEETEVPFDPFMSALAKDKKNTGSNLNLILPDEEGRVARVQCNNDAQFQGLCAEYLSEERRR
jgi:3-dehydroquinate synthase